jgi:type IV secretion system protein VirB6
MMDKVPSKLIKLCSLLLVVAVLFMLNAPEAYAQDADPNVCTSMGDRSDSLFSAAPPGANDPEGLLTEIFSFIKTVTESATEKLFNAFIHNSNYQYAVRGAFTLYIAIFGAMFMMGIVQATFGQVLIRLVKIGIIFSLIDPALGWVFFSDYVVTFFNDGTDQLIRGVMNIAAGLPANDPSFANVSPFYRLDRIAEFLIHPETIVAILGSATSGVFSLGMTGLMFIAFFGFIKLLINALQVYAVAFVVRTMLLGLAPIFFVFMLFERTKNLFNGWLNVLVSLSLQPILLFTFLAFMVIMIESAAVNMMSVELCWVTTAIGEGVNSQTQFWRFLDPSTGEPYLLDFTWEGNLQCTLADGSAGTGGDCPQFPIKIIDVLTFLLLVWLATRFAEVLDRVSNELASTFVTLDPAGRLAQYLEQDAAQERKEDSALNKRVK